MAVHKILSPNSQTEVGPFVHSLFYHCGAQPLLVYMHGCVVDMAVLQCCDSFLGVPLWRHPVLNWDTSQVIRIPLEKPDGVLMAHMIWVISLES